MIFELIVQPLAGAIRGAAEEMAEEIAGQRTSEAADAFQRMSEASAAAAAELLESTRVVFESGASFAAEELRPRLETAMDGLVEEGMGRLAEAQQGTAGILDACSSVMEAAAALAPPVNWARGIVDTISSLLEAMNLGL